MTTLQSSSESTGSQSGGWLPETIDRRVRVVAWLSLVVQIGIVATGGAVRLTGSGLGCPTWPRCTSDSFVVMPEQGMHGAIEFGNRMLTFVLVIVAVLAILSVVRMRRERRGLFVLAVTLGLGVPAQAILGGLTVLTGLNPWLVGAHFLLSAAMVVLATLLVLGVSRPPSALASRPPAWYAQAMYTAAFFITVAVVMGVVTTGSGPHAGDAATPRNGLNPELLQHLHSYPAYIAFVLTAVLVMAAATLNLSGMRAVVQSLLVLEVVQIALGITQSRMGLPTVLVGIHMVMACVIVATATAAVSAVRGERVSRPGRPASSRAPSAARPHTRPATS